jgi:peptide/nickel transport system substrate-binding protein
MRTLVSSIACLLLAFGSGCTDGSNSSPTDPGEPAGLTEGSAKGDLTGSPAGAPSATEAPLGPEYGWVSKFSEPELRRIAERICRAPRRSERDIPGPKGPGPVKADEFHPEGGTPAEPRQGGTIVHRINAEPRTLDPYLTSSAIGSELASKIVESLLDLDLESWEFTPQLAERYSVEDYVLLNDGSRHVGRLETLGADPVVLVGADGKTQSWPAAEVKKALRDCAFTFWLRKGVRFHNGDPFDAADVLFTWQLMKTPEVPIPHIQSYFTELEHYEKLDSHTVRAFWGEPYWRALDFVGGTLVYPSRAWNPNGLLESDPKAFGETFRQNPLASAPVGTGPYKFKSWKRGYLLKYERFDGYHSPELQPRYMDELHFRPMTDQVAALQALEAGEVDFIDRVDSAEAFREFKARTLDSGRFVYVETLYPVYYFIGWNLRRPMFQDRRVRWALALGALDIDRFIDEVYEGKAIRATQPQFQYGRASNLNLPPIAYDPEAAKELLAAAGWWDSDGDNVLDRDGKAFKFDFLIRTTGPSHPFVQLGERVKENLKNLGILVEIRILDWPSLLEAVDNRDFDAVQMGWAYGNPPHESDLKQIWHSDEMKKRGSNAVSYNNPEVDRLIFEAREETDPAKRVPLQRTISGHIYRDQPYLFLLTPTMFRVHNSKFRGVKIYLPRPGYSIEEWYFPAGKG